MGSAIDSDAMSVSCEKTFTDFDQTLTALIEDRDEAALCGNVKTTECLIKGKHVRVGTDRLNGCHFLCVQIKYCELGILFAGHECQTMLAVDVEAVASAATRQRVTTDYLIFGRIDLGQFILTMYRDKDTFGH